MKDSIIGLRELRENTDAYIAAVGKGQSFIVMKRSKPVLKITSPDDEDMWEQVANFTTIHRDGVSARGILREIRKLNAKS